MPACNSITRESRAPFSEYIHSCAYVQTKRDTNVHNEKGWNKWGQGGGERSKMLCEVWPGSGDVTKYTQGSRTGGRKWNAGFWSGLGLIYREPVGMQLWVRNSVKWKSTHNEASIRSTFWLLCTGWCGRWRSVIWVLRLYCCNRKAWVHMHDTDTTDSRDSLRKEGFLKVHSPRVQCFKAGQSWC